MQRFNSLRILASIAAFIASAAAPAPVFAQQSLTSVTNQPVETPVADVPASTPQPTESAPTPEQLGDAMMAQHRYQAAIEAYRLVAAPTPSVWNKMGIAQQMVFNLKAAALCYQASLRLNPNNSHVLNNLGTVYDSQQLYADAEKMYRRSIRISAGSAVAWKNLGTVLLARHNFKDGWEAYRHALALDPKTFEDRLTPKALNPRTTHDRGVLNYYMARGCVHAGQNDCAIDYLRKALNEGVTDEKHIAADDEFAVLRSDPAFRQLLASQQPQ